MTNLFQTEPNRKEARPHQVKALEQLRQSIGRGNRRVVLQLPTGAGKTFVASKIVAGALAKGNRVCFTVPLISLVDQTIAAFEAEGITDIGVIQASHHRTDLSQPVQIGSMQSMSRRGVPEAEVVIVDECHLQFDLLPKWMRDDPKRLFIGLTATPWARGMGDIWDDLVRPVTMQELIDAGYLSPFRVYAPSHPDLSGVKTMAGDYHEGQLASVMSEGALVADVVDTWLQRAAGLPTLIFAVNLAHAEKIQAAFAARGIAMGYCDASVDLIERQHLFRQMARGDIAGVVNVGTLTTGVDADVRCIVMARPTKSEMLFVQCIGRGLRTADGKDHCLILDHSDNHARLGFVTSISHERLLSGKEKAPKPRENEKPEQTPRECPSCGAVKQRGPCPACGFEPKRQSEIEFEEGELVELTPAKESKREYSMAEKADFHAGLLWLAHSRGRKVGWAAHKYRERFGVWPVGEAKHVKPKGPSEDVRAFVLASDIRYAKGKGRAK
jgi:DNA repair protein RadD